MAQRVITLYYAATIIFLLLDYLLGLNLRVAFLDAFPLWRAAYYAVLLLCLAIIMRQPSVAAIVGAFESLVTLAALIISFGSRVMLVSDAMLEGGDVVRMPEVVNFLISGSIAYYAWARGIRELAP